MCYCGAGCGLPWLRGVPPAGRRRQLGGHRRRHLGVVRLDRLVAGELVARGAIHLGQVREGRVEARLIRVPVHLAG